MRIMLSISALLATVAAAPAFAACSVSSDVGAAVKEVGASTTEGAQIVVSMSMMPKLLRIDYKSAAKRPECDLGPLAAGDARYELWGEDKPSRERRAIPKAKGAPIALVIPVTDIIKAIEASRAGKPGTVEGYLLATITASDLTGWRFYTGMPSPETLRHDMAEVLAGGASPIFRNGTDGNTSLFVHKG
ncbi:hypothetical protein [Sphingomonas quercus]|uniref:Lipoprotein n=1 Tax=Sphingomonas quercus TaxID=2842451 RepID=A0ABS6BJK6_9SPHN|nr:hypothetical protein [Sphingomonas quercus]MBU3077616.1 hypothetical protein [Sphingomonas quercus]